uniref:Uncharacterized protein n=1 Tax=Panagrolaimus sp. PS1159 TaxID=55785 RepID=A0AC35FFW0_9BILA
MMKLLVFIGLFLCASAQYRPPPYGPAQPEKPHIVIEPDYDALKVLAATGLEEFLPHKRNAPESSNNYYFNVVQNFFLPKPVNAPKKEIAPSLHSSVDDAVILEKEPHHARHCKVDHDCKIRVQKGVILHVPSFCNNGHCKLGRRHFNHENPLNEPF